MCIRDRLYDGRLYVPIASQEENAGASPLYSCCRFRGNLVAIKASDGAEIWRTFTTPEAKPTKKSATGVQFYGPSGATIWHSPALDLKRKLVYVVTGNGYSDPDIKTADAIMAMDMKTGAIRWSQQANPDMFNWSCAGRQGAEMCIRDRAYCISSIWHPGTPVLGRTGGFEQFPDKEFRDREFPPSGLTLLFPLDLS